MNNLFLWEILVPRTQDGKEIPLAYHKKWDEKIRDISGGLTILKTTKGQWVNPAGRLFSEPMIPVRIMCTRRQIEKIADITAAHYNQESVMYYCVSREVVIKNY